MLELSAEQVQILVKKLSIMDSFPIRLLGHSYAMSVRNLYLRGRLTLISVDDLRNFKRQDDETDLSKPASICTYEDLATVSLNKDLTVTLFIRESTTSFSYQTSAPRVNFTLSGDWWAVTRNSDKGFAYVIESSFKHHLEDVFEAEELARKQNRCKEIEAQLFSGTYNPQ